MNSTSEREPSSGENSTSSVYCSRVRDGRAGLALHVLARGLELALDVDVAGGDEGVDARALGVLDRVPGGVDVLLAGAGEAADHGALDLARDRLHGLEVAGRGDREAGLDHVHAEPRELVRDLELLLPVERDARRLLAVAQGRVEDLYSVLSRCVPRPAPLRWPYLVLLELAAGGRHALFPPKGEKKEKAQVGELRHGERTRTSQLQHDLADVRALVDVAVRGGSVLEREGLAPRPAGCRPARASR